MRTVYTATQRSLAEYASQAWTPWLSATNRENLERAQRKAARCIVGLVSSTPSEVVLREAGLDPLGDRFTKAAVVTYERWSQLEEGDSRRELVDQAVPQRTRRGDWRTRAGASREAAWEGLDVGDGREAERESRVGRRPPWRRGVPCRVRETDARKTDPEDLRRSRAEQCLWE